MASPPGWCTSGVHDRMDHAQDAETEQGRVKKIERELGKLKAETDATRERGNSK